MTVLDGEDGCVVVGVVHGDDDGGRGGEGGGAAVGGRDRQADQGAALAVQRGAQLQEACKI